MRVPRLFALLDHLRGRRTPVSAQQLADDLGVSVRTVYRDMATLQALGVPLRGEAGIGFRLERGTFLPPLRFDGDELDAIMLGLQWSARMGDPALSDGAFRVMGKLRASLPSDDGERLLEQAIRPVSSDQTLAPSQAGCFAALRSAIRNRHTIRIDYCRLDGQSSQRTIRPLGLFAFDAVWLVTAWCELRDAFRHFRLDRITAIKETGQVFVSERGMRLENALAGLGH